MRSTLALMTCVLLVACSDDENNEPTDTGSDVVADTDAGDAVEDTFTDTSGEDTSPDTEADTVADTLADTEVDTVEDTAEDTADDADGSGDGSGDVAAEPPFDLTFTGEASAHGAQTLWVAVVDTFDDSVIESASTVVAIDGTFSFSWPDLLGDDTSYLLHFFADFNSNSTCDAPPTDHGWEVDLGTPTDDVTYHFEHNTDFTNVCDSFPEVDGLYDLDFSASVAPHAGQVFEIAIVASAGPSTVTTDSGTVGEDGTIAFTFENVMEHVTEYKVHFYADVNESGSCDTPPTDHAWEVDLSFVVEDRTVEFAHDTDFTDVCSSFE